ncbi:MAG: putative manganese transporter [Pseudomonadota bacterium]|nr:putative manganese transporter [Pseudomonadota bacterium]
MASASIGTKNRSPGQGFPRPITDPLRLGLLTVLIIVSIVSPRAGGLIANSLADAFLQVTVFVAFTLTIFYTLEAWFRIDAKGLLKKYSAWQVPVAAFLGALPGCGGAVMVITQYVRGGISFGAVVSVLTATMGDAAFLLLAQEPLTGVGIFAAGVSVGVVSGYGVDLIHGTDFLRSKSTNVNQLQEPVSRTVNSKFIHVIWWLFLIPGLVIGIAIAFQVDVAALFGVFENVDTILFVGVGGALLCISVWCFFTSNTPESGSSFIPQPSFSRVKALNNATSKVIGDTCFITVWVAMAFLIYELGVLFTGLDLRNFFQIWAPLVPLIAILIGFIPGCGPQVVVAAMYLNGAIPLSAELGNAISNDGDALFPAIAIAPKAAVIATLYSAVPALIVAYGWYWLFE